MIPAYFSLMTLRRTFPRARQFAVIGVELLVEQQEAGNARAGGSVALTVSTSLRKSAYTSGREARSV